MKILQRYILSELLKVFLLLLAILTVMLVFVGVLKEAQENSLGVDQIVQILPFILPSLMPYSIPATLLLAVCVVYGRLAGDQEVIAAKSAGINPLALMMPTFVFAACLVVGTFILTDRIIPWAVIKMQQRISDALEDIFLDRLQATHLISEPNQGYTIFVKDVQGKTLISPTFQYSPKNHSTTTLQAETATIDFNLEKRVVVLNLVNCHIDVPGETMFFVSKESYEFPLSKSMGAQNKPRHMRLETIRSSLRRKTLNIQENILKRDIRAAFALGIGDFEALADSRMRQADQGNQSQRFQMNKMNAEIHNRFALSASCFFFVLLGVPYSISQRRTQFLTTFFVCFLPILLIYYPAALLMMSLAKRGDVDPAWAMWVPNLILFSTSTVFLHRVIKH